MQIQGISIVFIQLVLAIFLQLTLPVDLHLLSALRGKKKQMLRLTTGLPLKCDDTLLCASLDFPEKGFGLSSLSLKNVPGVPLNTELALLSLRIKPEAAI